jgi:thiol-disulfide isomerase/thioredoxin
MEVPRMMDPALSIRSLVAFLAAPRQWTPVAAAIAICAAGGSSSLAATPSPAAALALKPVQDGVDYELVPDDQFEQCRVQDLEVKGWKGWAVLGPDGSLLRRFADTNGDRDIDLWSYYKFGVEVYRDVDTDFDKKADQYRWLNTGGTRWGLDDDEDGRVDRWKQISAEEVSAELVAALAGSDAARFQSLLISESELKKLGLGTLKSEEIGVKSERAARDFLALAKRQTAVAKNAKWVQFAATPPGVVPAGTDGSTRDVVVYENAVAMFENDAKSGQLLVGTVVRVGDAWRLVELPSVGGGDDAITQTTGIFFTPGGTAMDSGEASSIGEKTQELVGKLESLDQSLAEASSPESIQKLHDARADLVEELIESSGNRTERDTWVRQLVDTLSVAVQSGAYPDGVARLGKVATRFCEDDDSLKAYADYRAIETEYVVRQTPDADFAKVQNWYLDSLTGFVDRYARTPEAAQAWLQLALSKEFEDKEREALGYYKKVASQFPKTDAGEKAAGAVRRLESVGQRIDLQGTTIDGQPFRLSSLRGKPVVLHYWATWCEPCKQDMKLLRRLQASYQRAGLQLVGVNVDITREMASDFLRANPLPWTQLFEEGALESSRLAKAFGVQTLPTMMLVDQDGKVVRHNVRAAELDEELNAMVTR